MIDIDIDKLHCSLAEAHVCEQLAQGCGTAGSRTREQNIHYAAIMAANACPDNNKLPACAPVLMHSPD